MERNIDLPLLPTLAQAGRETEDTQGIVAAQCDMFRIPAFAAHGATALITVHGDSMVPTYQSGDLVAIAPVTDTSWFDWGRVYVLDTSNGPLIKRLFPGREKGKLTLHSDNSEAYLDLEIPMESIYHIFRVVGSIRME